MAHAALVEKMAASYTPKSGAKTLSLAVETQSRLKKCWSTDVNWTLYPTVIKTVS